MRALRINLQTAAAAHLQHEDVLPHIVAVLEDHLAVQEQNERATNRSKSFFFDWRDTGESAAQQRQYSPRAKKFKGSEGNSSVSDSQ